MNIQRVKKSATEPGLESWGDVECPLGAPACQLRGIKKIIPDEGPPLAIEAGDTLFFSPNTLGIWDIQETVRKVYVLL